MLRINTISRPVFFVRDGKTIETNNNGGYITMEEFSTLQSEMEVVCIDDATGDRYVYTPSQVDVLATAIEPVTPQTPATDAGVVPDDLSAGKKNTKA